MDDSVILTKHGADRIKFRVGPSRKNAEQNAEKALKYGLTHAETRSRLKSYLNKLYLQRGTANNMRVYHHHVYLFRGKLLITVLPLPANLCKIADKLQREKNAPPAPRDGATT